MTTHGSETTERMSVRCHGQATLRVLVAVAVMVSAWAIPDTARADVGSSISGLVWADTNRDGIRQPDEVAQSGVSVELLDAGGNVAATTTTDEGGIYGFADMADGDYTVRVAAPGAFTFPAATGTDNDFVTTGPPATGEPQRGVSPVLTVEGDSQQPDIDAGMQPVADFTVDRLPIEDACEGFASTGTPPFDADDSPGNDSGTGNCIVRTNDTVTQNYSVSLTGLPTGAEVENVVAEFTVSSPDGAALELAGPGAEGMPAGCLAAAQGADPPSSVTNNPDGSITVRCNIGTMSSNVAALTFAYRVGGDSAVPSHASVEMHADAAQGEAGVSNTVQGPVVEITGDARWDLTKINYPDRHPTYHGPIFTERTIDGVEVAGYDIKYQYRIEDASEGGTGGGELDWPVTFTDRMSDFPNARIVECRPTNLADNPAIRSPWTLTCPDSSVPQGTDGWEMSIAPNSGSGTDTGIGYMVATIFVPQEDMNLAIDSSWQPGDDFPNGTLTFTNEARDTDDWTMVGGQPNFGDGFEPGWDGAEATGNNIDSTDISASGPEWDLIKQVHQNPVFSTEVIDGEEQSGYFMWFRFHIRDLAGIGNVAPWLDSPVTFTDQLIGYPDAQILACVAHPDSRGRTTGVPTCDEGPQGTDGWEMSFEPNQWGYTVREGIFRIRVFIPADDIFPGNPCEADPEVTFELTNEAINSDGWTAAGVPNNGTGFEPGWDGDTADGNNVVSADYRIRPNDSQCFGNPQVSGFKRYHNAIVAPEVGHNFSPIVAGKFGRTQVHFNANADADIENPILCDVFDVSILKIVDQEMAWPQWTSTGQSMIFVSSAGATTDDFLVEYAIGPNNNDTQAGPIGADGMYPVDPSSTTEGIDSCHDYEGPWETDPAAFGPDWQDHVNMVRMRPVESDFLMEGPSDLRLQFEFEARALYNGGPNDGERIPPGVWVYNHGGRPGIVVESGQIVDQTWVTNAQRLPTGGMRLAIGKATSPTQYLPGSDVVWDIHLRIDDAASGATMQNVQVVDTLPDDVNFNAACTQDVLPDGVTVGYNPATRQATFSLGDIEIVNAPTQWVSHPTNAPDGLLQICATIDELAQPGETFVNQVQASADNSENAPTAQHAVQAVGAGQMGISKSVDKPFVASGETYTWSLEWGNTSATLAFQDPDIIDVLPWNGDADAGSDSQRDQFASDYTGLALLTGPLSQPTYVRGGTGVGDDVAGIWYYSTADPPTIDHDPRDPSNDSPEAAGGVWQTEAEIAAGDGFDAVTAIRFVSDGFLTTTTRVEALIPAVSTSTDLDNVYVNRAMMFSGTFADQPLLSNEPFVLMPGFSLGDLVWIDDNGDGLFDGDEQGVPGVTVEVLDGNGDVIEATSTDDDGRWFVPAVPAGTYSARIPAEMFQAGGPLEGYSVHPTGSSDANDGNENVNNNNTDTPDPVVSGLTSSPVTMDYVYQDDQLVGGDAPTGDNVASLGGDIIPDEFTNFTLDLTVARAPDIDIEKATNGEDADEPTGPPIFVGDPVTWTYVVTNTGTTDLFDVTVTDDMLDDSEIDCGDGTDVVAGPLAPDESFECTATGIAIEGQYANTGTVTGTSPDDVEVTDDDPSHYLGTVPGIDIEKATNGEDADEPTGPFIGVGAEVTWTYVVTNTGNVELANIVVTDDRLDDSAVDCGDGTNVFAGPLAVDASIECTATGTAALGQYANVGFVTGVPPAGPEVDDDDPSHHYGADPAVDIEKATNGEDADEPMGPSIPAGDPVTWTYVVTNTGNVDLTNLVVSDDRLDDAHIDCGDGTNGDGTNVVAGPLAPGEAFVCTATGAAVEGQYANIGTVTADPPDDLDDEVDDQDPSHYFGSVGSVDIEKSTNGEDADDGPGPSVAVDDSVTWTYAVTNTGDVELTNLVVSDDQLDDADIDCGDGTNVVAGPLGPGESFTCTATGAAVEGQYANVGSVIGDRPDGSQSADDDPSHYFAGSDDDQVPDELQITKAADTSLATPDGVVTYTVTVTNTGSLDYTAAEPAEVVDDLIDVLDDAAWMVGNATISAGRVSFSSPELTWTGPLAVGDEVTITYAVRVNPTLTGSGALHNTIVADASNCRPGAAAGATSDPVCETTTQIVPPAPPDPITVRPIPVTG